MNALQSIPLITGDKDYDRYLFEERAGILEHEAGMTREAAEDQAIKHMTIKQRKGVNHGA